VIERSCCRQANVAAFDRVLPGKQRPIARCCSFPVGDIERLEGLIQPRRVPGW